MQPFPPPPTLLPSLPLEEKAPGSIQSMPLAQSNCILETTSLLTYNDFPLLVICSPRAWLFLCCLRYRKVTIGHKLAFNDYRAVLFNWASIQYLKIRSFHRKCHFLKPQTKQNKRSSKLGQPGSMSGLFSRNGSLSLPFTHTSLLCSFGLTNGYIYSIFIYSLCVSKISFNSFLKVFNYYSFHVEKFHLVLFQIILNISWSI